MEKTVYFLNKRGYYLFERIAAADIGRNFNKSAQKVNKVLESKGIIYKDSQDGKFYLTGQYKHQGLEYIYEQEKYTHMYWTLEGARWVEELLIKEGWEERTDIPVRM